MTHFDATLSAIGSSTVLRLPPAASEELPSRGQVAVHGTINGVEFQTVLEPDGSFGHWMRVDDTLLASARVTLRRSDPDLSKNGRLLEPADDHP